MPSAALVLRTCQRCQHPFYTTTYKLKSGCGKFCSAFCAAKPPRPLAERFWEKVDKRGPQDCWEWNASKINGYGSIAADNTGVKIFAHRVAYELTYGPIPKDLFVLHACDNRACVNPAHLEAGTKAKNILDSYLRGRRKQMGVRGEKNHNAVLTQQQVKQIREELNTGHSARKLAARFGVDKSTILSIKHCRTWRQV